jgi:hypothetical protein
MAASGYSDPIRPVRRGGSYHVGGGPLRYVTYQKIFSCGFLSCTLLKKCRPDLGTQHTLAHPRVSYSRCHIVILHPILLGSATLRIGSDLSTLHGAEGRKHLGGGEE